MQSRTRAISILFSFWTITLLSCTNDGVSPPEPVELAVSASTAAAATAISYGQTIASTLSTPTEVDVYTFFGKAGDPVFVMMSGGTVAMDPEVELFDPSGTRLGGQGTSTEAIIRVTLPVDGTYTIHAMEWGQADAGPYGLHVQRLVDPVDAIELAYGDTHEASLSPTGDADAYVFAGQAGDPIFAMNSAGTVAMDPILDLYDAQGIRLTTAASATEATILLTLPTDGTYTLIARESNAGDTGPYGVHLQHRTNPVGAQPIAYGQTMSGSLSPRGDADAWTFTGQAGDAIFAMNTAGTVSMDPFLDLFDAQGNRLTTAGSATEAIIRLTLPTDGQYVLLAREGNAADTGPYGLYLQRMNGPLNGEPIAFGQTLSRGISPKGDADLYTFTGAGGEQIRVQVVENVQLAPVIELYNSAGQRLASAGGVSFINLNFTLPDNDDYHILIYEQNAGDTGPYTVSLAMSGAVDMRLTLTDNGGTATPGQSLAYMLTYENVGSRTAQGVILSETVPDHTTSLSNPGWEVAPAGSGIPCDGRPASTTCEYAVSGAVGPGATPVSVGFGIRVDDLVPAGASALGNTAAVSDDSGSDPNLADNQATVSTPLDAAPDLAVMLDDGAATPLPGQSLSYAVMFANQGDQEATGVTLSAVVPDHTTFDQAGSDPSWSCADGSSAGTVCTLSVGSLIMTGSPVAFSVKVNNPVPSGATQISLTVSIADDGLNGPDQNPSNDVATAITAIQTAAAATLSLRGDVQALVDTGTLGSNDGRSLLSILDAALKGTTANQSSGLDPMLAGSPTASGNPSQSVGLLERFVARVDNLESRGRLPTPDANRLTAAARAIIRVLEAA